MAKTQKNKDTATFYDVLTRHVKAEGRKPVNSQDMIMSGVENQVLVTWRFYVKELKNAVDAYVTEKFHQRALRKWDEQAMNTLRNRIFPHLKKVLKEVAVDQRKIPVSEWDVEDIIGFAWDFAKSGHGYSPALVEDDRFRWYVETLCATIALGFYCRTAEQQATLDKWESLHATVDSALRTLGEEDKKRKDIEARIANAEKLGEQTYLKVLKGELRELEDAVSKAKTAKFNAERKITELEPAVERINLECVAR